MIGLGVVVLALSFMPFGGAGEGEPPHVLAMRAVSAAPLASVAAITGRSADALLADLAKAGVRLPDAQASIDSVANGDWDMQGRAMRVLFAAR